MILFISLNFAMFSLVVMISSEPTLKNLFLVDVPHSQATSFAFALIMQDYLVLARRESYFCLLYN